MGCYKGIRCKPKNNGVGLYSGDRPRGGVAKTDDHGFPLETAMLPPLKNNRENYLTALNHRQKHRRPFIQDKKCSYP